MLVSINMGRLVCCSNVALNPRHVQHALTRRKVCHTPRINPAIFKHVLEPVYTNSLEPTNILKLRWPSRLFSHVQHKSCCWGNILSGSSDRTGLWIRGVPTTVAVGSFLVYLSVVLGQTPQPALRQQQKIVAC